MDCIKMRRRDLLLWAASASANANASASASASAGFAAASDAQEVIRLDEAARQSGRHFGFAVNPALARNDPIKTILRQHAGVITAENAMKWRFVEKTPGGRDYTQADAVAAIAADLHALLRGHTMAWHQSTPNHLASAMPDDFRKAQTAYLQDMALRYKGRVHTWDVLNEVIDGDAKLGNGLRNSVLSTLWGADRYPAFFEQARVLDPRAKLAYNDYGMEQDHSWCERRRSAVLRMLEGWVKQKTPIDVMGLQSHLDLSRRFSAGRLHAFFNELSALGLGIQITELDVRDSVTTGDLAARDAGVAALYRDFLDVCLSHPAVEMVVMWSVTDAETWLNQEKFAVKRPDGQPMRPTLFDTTGQPKPAFHAVNSSLHNAATRYVCPTLWNESPQCLQKSS